eukprot:scaffold423420_cov53-Prasinocladus_malaysianus.AAC.2
MSFIYSMARDFITNNMMESPRERDRVFEEHVRKSHQAAQITRFNLCIGSLGIQLLAHALRLRKETWAQPTRTWGFWNSDKSNMVVGIFYSLQTILLRFPPPALTSLCAVNVI